MRTLTKEQLLAESHTLEFKKSLSLQRQGLESLDGMINSDDGKGTIIFGVTPEGDVVGIEPGDADRAQQSLAQHIRSKFDPTLICHIDIAECEGKRLLVLEAERDSSVPYYEYDGRAFIREGTTTRQLSRDEKASLTKRRDRDHHTGPWRCSGCGAIVGQLISFGFTGSGMKKSYRHSCGGEYWPM